MRGRRLVSLTTNLGLLVASTVATLLLLEFGLRWFRPQPLAAVARSARLGWTHKPNTDILYEREEYRVPVHFSSWGLRDREYALEKPAGTCRIAMLGDSFVEALQVPLDSCVAKRLEARLNATRPGGRRYEVINFGVAGFGTCQQLLLFEEEAARFHPDVVISQLYMNDLDDDRRFGMCGLDAGGALQVAPAASLSAAARFASAAKSFLYQHSHLWMFVSTRRPRHVVTRASQSPVATSGGETSVPSCPGRHTMFEWRLTLRDEPADAVRATALHAALWERLAAESRASGARFLGVLGVSRTELEPAVYQRTLVEEGCRAEAHDEDLLPTRLRAAAEARGVPVLDLLPAFRAYAGGEHLHFRIDGHWNAAGHRVAAQALYDDLLARGILNGTLPEGDR